MKTKITKRDVGFFFLGVIVILLISLIWNWEDNVADFKAGLKGEPRIESSK